MVTIAPRTSSVRSPVRGNAANSSAVMYRCCGNVDMAHLSLSRIPYSLTALAYRAITRSYVWLCYHPGATVLVYGIGPTKQGACNNGKSSERTRTLTG